MRSPFQTRNRGQRKAKSTLLPSACPRRDRRTGKITLVFDAIGSVFALRHMLSWSSRATLNSRYRQKLIPGVHYRYLRPSVHRGARPNACGGRDAGRPRAEERRSLSDQAVGGRRGEGSRQDGWALKLNSEPNEISFRARSNDSMEGCNRADSIGSYLNLVKFSDDGLGRGSPLE